MAFLKRKAIDWLCRDVACTSILPDSCDATAIKDLAMYTAVGLIADLVCGCERQVYKAGRLTRDGNWYAWNISANANQSASDLLTRWIYDIYCKRDGGLIIQSGDRLYNADVFTIDEFPMKENIFSGISIGPVQLNRTYKASKVYYVKVADAFGHSIKQQIDRAYAQYIPLLSTASKNYSRSGGEKYSLAVDHLPQGTAAEDTKYRQILQQSLQSFVNAESAVYPLQRGETLTRLGGSSSSGSASEYADIRKDIYAIVAEALHLPASLMDGNMNNTAEVVNQALTFSICPLCDRLGKEITRKTFGAEQVQDGCMIKFDTTKIRVRDVADTADSLDKLIASGIMCIDEARELCSLPRLNESWSSAHYLTKNYDDIETPHEI